MLLRLVEGLSHKKLLVALALVIVVAVISGISCVLISPQQPPELSIQEQVRDEAMAYIKANHPETAQFMNNIAWAGGRITPEDILGAETYTYISQGWNATIQYAVVPNPIYTVTADYSATSTNGGASIPYRVIWQGTWENETIAETSYTLAQ
jgi:hypothetical protein